MCDVIVFDMVRLFCVLSCAASLGVCGCVALLVGCGVPCMLYAALCECGAVSCVVRCAVYAAVCVWRHRRLSLAPSFIGGGIH